MTSSPTGAATRIYASIRDQILAEITSGVYPAGALLPSIREITQRWGVSTTTARRVLDELAAAGYARKEGTRGHISTGGPSATEPSTAAQRDHVPPQTTPTAPVSGRLTIWPTHTIAAGDTILPDERTETVALDVRTETPSAEVAF